MTGIRAKRPTAGPAGSLLFLIALLLAGCGLGFGIDVPSAGESADGADSPTGSPSEGANGDLGIDAGGPPASGGQFGATGGTHAGGSLGAGGLHATGGAHGTGGLSGGGTGGSVSVAGAAGAPR